MNENKKKLIHKNQPKHKMNFFPFYGFKNKVGIEQDTILNNNLMLIK